MSDNLKKLIELEKEAVDFGFEWPNSKSIINQAISECLEIEEAINKNESLERIQEEVGDLIHAAISICRFTGLNIEQTLSKLTLKFSNRIEALKLVAKQHQLDSLVGQDSDFMLQLWEEAKKFDKKI